MSNYWIALMIFWPFSLSLKPYVNYVTSLIHSDLSYVSTYFRLRRLRKGRIREEALKRMKRDICRLSLHSDDLTGVMPRGRHLDRKEG